MTQSYSDLPLSPLRQAIASRMMEAIRSIPHFRLSMDVEMESLLDLRLEMRKRESAAAYSINDFIIKACALALIDEPAVNIQWVEGAIRRFNVADISIITAIEGGLSTPVVRNAHTKSVGEISREVSELARRAAARQLTHNEIAGGSFSISNLGMFGVDRFDAIINAPQCAILGVGAVRPHVVVTGRSTTRVSSMANFTMSVDHRAIDGVGAAAFMQALRERIQKPLAWVV